eukprot:m.14070 g.14070  ORF g.14070 m.14070 type:complete len:93 (-) comp4247_c0_seq2:99-377(-)
MIICHRSLLMHASTNISCVLILHLRLCRNEFQADRFSVSLGKGEELSEALIKLHRDNSSFPVNDWLFSALHHSHPPIVQRLAAIEAEMKKSN